jgi:hypothetical protein
MSWVGAANWSVQPSALPIRRSVAPSLGVRLVTARAAPDAMPFEAGEVLLHGRFPKRKAELIGRSRAVTMRAQARARTGRMGWCEG